MTYEELYQYLHKMTTEQRQQLVQFIPPVGLSSTEKSVGLLSGFDIGTVKDYCSSVVNPDDPTPVMLTRSNVDGKHHPEEIVLLSDWCFFWEDGDCFHFLTEKGWVGNVSGKITPVGEDGCLPA